MRAILRVRPNYVLLKMTPGQVRALNTVLQNPDAMEAALFGVSGNMVRAMTNLRRNVSIAAELHAGGEVVDLVSPKAKEHICE